jgi:hypothetical protein
MNEQYKRKYKNQNYSKKQFKKNIKNHYTGCGTSICNNWETYQVRGNFCNDCMQKARLYNEIDNLIRNIDDIESENKKEMVRGTINTLKQELRSAYHEEYQPFKQRMRGVKKLLNL